MSGFVLTGRSRFSFWNTLSQSQRTGVGPHPRRSMTGMTFRLVGFRSSEPQSM